MVWSLVVWLLVVWLLVVQAHQQAPLVPEVRLTQDQMVVFLLERLVVTQCRRNQQVWLQVNLTQVAPWLEAVLVMVVILSTVVLPRAVVVFRPRAVVVFRPRVVVVFRSRVVVVFRPRVVVVFRPRVVVVFRSRVVVPQVQCPRAVVEVLVQDLESNQ